MYVRLCFVLLLMSAFIGLEDAVRESYDGGFGPNIKWYTSLEEGLKVAQAEYKPIMMIIHRSVCPACKKLKPSLLNSPEYAALSEYFVMVNIDDETIGEAQTAAQYTPDGVYVPRILFLDWNGEHRPEFWNTRSIGKFKYYFSDASSVCSTMRNALDFMIPIANYYKGQYEPKPMQATPTNSILTNI